MTENEKVLGVPTGLGVVGLPVMVAPILGVDQDPTETETEPHFEGVPVAVVEPLLKPLVSNSVAIIGFSYSRERFDWDNTNEEGDRWEEVWICNRLGLQPDVKRWTRHFDPHPLSWSEAKFKPEDWRTYNEWIHKDYGDNPIYLMSPEDKEAIPNWAEFPMKEVVDYFGREYFTSAIGWQIGLAIMLLDKSELPGPKRLGLWGIELRHETEYAYQRPQAEWLLGIAEGKGIEVVLQEDSALLNMDRNAALYGVEFEDGGGVFGELEKAFEDRMKEINENMERLNAENVRVLSEMNTWDGGRQEVQMWFERIKQRRRGGVL